MLREFNTTKPALQGMQRGILQAESKACYLITLKYRKIYNTLVKVSIWSNSEYPNTLIWWFDN